MLNLDNQKREARRLMPRLRVLDTFVYLTVITKLGTKF